MVLDVTLRRTYVRYMTAVSTAQQPTGRREPGTGEPLDLVAELAENLADRAVAAAAGTAGADGDGVGLVEAGRLLSAVDRILAAVVTVLMRVDRDQVIAAEGLTPESWLRAVARRTGADAGMLQIAADRLADMPATLAAFQTGTLSWGAVRGIVTATRSLTAAQRRWLDATVAGDHVRLGRVDGDTVVADAEQAADRARPELQRARADRAAAGQRLVLQPGMDGGGAAFACLDAETFTAVQTAIASLTHDARGRRVASNVEALRALARQRLTRSRTHDPRATGDDADAGDLAEAGGAVDAGGAPSTARPEMIIVTDISLLADPVDGLDHRGLDDALLLDRTREVARLLWRQDRPAPRLTAAAVQRLECDAILRPVLTDGPRILGTAEPYARVSSALRAALVARDGGCRFAGCHRPVDVCEAHHLRHRAHGGATCLANLALLCGPHHRAVHEGGWTPVLYDDAAMTFTRRGTTLHSVPHCAAARPHASHPPPAGRPRRSLRAHDHSQHTAAAEGHRHNTGDRDSPEAQHPRPPDPARPPLPF